MLAWDATPASENYLVRLRERLDALQVVERERRSIRIGGGWGTEDEFRVRGEWYHRNLFGQGEGLDITSSEAVVAVSYMLLTTMPNAASPSMKTTPERMMMRPGLRSSSCR